MVPQQDVHPRSHSLRRRNYFRKVTTHRNSIGLSWPWLRFVHTPRRIDNDDAWMKKMRNSEAKHSGRDVKPSEMNTLTTLPTSDSGERPLSTQTHRPKCWNKNDKREKRSSRPLRHGVKTCAQNTKASRTWSVRIAPCYRRIENASESVQMNSNADWSMSR